MKYFVLIVLGMGIIQNAFGQNDDLHVVSSAGASYQANNLSLDWTLGEVIIQTFENPTVLLSQGFHQPSYTLVSVRPIPTDIGAVMLIANPISDALAIKMTFTNIQTGQLTFYDMSGKMLWQKSFEGMDIIENHPTDTLPDGAYLLVVSLTEGSFIHAYQIVKTN